MSSNIIAIPIPTTSQRTAKIKLFTRKQLRKSREVVKKREASKKREQSRK